MGTSAATTPAQAFRMNPDVKRDLITALRSGSYRQVRGALRASDAHCVMGLLVHLYGIQPTSGTHGVADSTWREVLAWAGLSERDAYRLMRLNDRGASFDQIANHLESDTIEELALPAWTEIAKTTIAKDLLASLLGTIEIKPCRRRSHDRSDPPPRRPANIARRPRSMTCIEVRARAA